jgi:hypothetical protein
VAAAAFGAGHRTFTDLQERASTTEKYLLEREIGGPRPRNIDTP